MIDRTTRWPEVVPLKSISADVVADAFVATWVARFGVPSKLTTDRGTQCIGLTWQCLWRMLGVRHITTCAYHPQSNGLVERFHRQLKEVLHVRSGGANWLEHLPWVLLGFRTTPKEEANISSAEAALGVELQLPGQPLPVDRPFVQCAEPSLIPNTTRSYADVVAGQEEEKKTFIYVREGQAREPLASTYSGPYRVLEERGKALKLQIGEKEDWVAVERTKRHCWAAPVDPAVPPTRGWPKKKPAEDRERFCMCAQDLGGPV